MGNVAAASYVDVVNYSSYPVTSRAGVVLPGTMQYYCVPCSIFLESGNRITVENTVQTQVEEYTSEMQKVVTRCDGGQMKILVFNTVGGFDCSVQHSLLSHIKVSEVYNHTGRMYDAYGSYGGWNAEPDCWLSNVVGKNMQVKDGMIHSRRAGVFLIFSQDGCRCYLRDPNEPLYIAVKNLSSRSVAMTYHKMTGRQNLPAGRTLSSHPWVRDIVFSDGQEYAFPAAIGCDHPQADGLLLRSELDTDDDRYRVGIITDNPRWCLALRNESAYKLTITLRLRNKQKIVDSGVYVEYCDVVEIRTPCGTALGYLTACAGDVLIDGCRFRVSQRDVTTTLIEVM